jgi:aspartyl-tRNA(Asn)/glutamyl-tRNA(Gln) amidotransferase subunit A
VLTGYVDPEVGEICRRAVEVFADLGAIVDDATPTWGSPEEANWHGVWIPGYASE